MNNLKQYKLKQIKVFFRFLKDLGVYKTYTNLMKEQYNHYIEVRKQHMMSFVDISTLYTFKEFISYRLFDEPPYQFLYYSKHLMDDMLYADVLWLYHIIGDRFNSIFDSVDVEMARRRLRLLKNF